MIFLYMHMYHSALQTNKIRKNQCNGSIDVFLDKLQLNVQEKSCGERESIEIYNTSIYLVLYIKRKCRLNSILSLIYVWSHLYQIVSAHGEDNA